MTAVRRYKVRMPLPPKTIRLTLPDNLWRALKREARRVDCSAGSLVLSHVMGLLQRLPDPDASPAMPRSSAVAPRMQRPL